jgi:hypothetical protein
MFDNSHHHSIFYEEKIEKSQFTLRWPLKHEIGNADMYYYQHEHHGHDHGHGHSCGS